MQKHYRLTDHLLNRSRKPLFHCSRYDPKMNAWTKQAPMLTRRARAVAAVLEGHLYVMGGNDGDMALSSGETVFDVKP